MKNNYLLVISGFLVLITFISTKNLCPNPVEETDNRIPNILIITCHDIGANIGCYGVETLNTPNIDKLAKQGVMFSNFYSTSGVCSPGRASLHTGRYPQSNGVMGLTHSPWWWKLNESEKHTAQLLKEQGYKTYLIGLNHIDNSPKRLGYDNILSLRNNAEETVKETIDLINTSKISDSPFFAKVGFFEVHRKFVNGSDSSKGIFVPGFLKGTKTMRQDLAKFQGSIRYFDEKVGEIMKVLENSDIAGNTLVVITSEHGMPYPGAKWTVRKAGIEIPLIMYQPGSIFSGGKVHSEVMSNVDVLPTILEYTNMKIPDNIEGYSFLPFMTGKENDPPRTMAFSQYTPDLKRDNLSRSIITDRYHLIRYFDQGRTVKYPVDVDPVLFAKHVQRCKTSGARPFVQLFDIKEDPFELRNIASQEEYADIVEDLSRHLFSWMKEVEDPLLDGPLRTPYYNRAIEDFLKISGGM